ncbi:TPA: transcription elongation factor GreA, partial [bacterium]|nr:transcription elongation factor GreA [bacterium]
SIVSRGLIVTEKKYTEKTALLNKLINEDVPANQKEIAFALSLGDLRENAEYKAAKEKQDELNSKIAKLKNEIERAQIFDKSTASTNKISFGTKVILLNLDTNNNETFTILGPWESEPSNNIISYLSPFGKKLINHKVGDTLSFTINEKTFNYKVVKIDLADI